MALFAQEEGEEGEEEPVIRNAVAASVEVNGRPSAISATLGYRGPLFTLQTLHGLLGGPPCECVATSGVCCSGMAAMKYAYLSVLAGTAQSAVVTGSELVSLALRASQFDMPRGQEVTQDPYLGFSREFLRFMLSDGAGAYAVGGQQGF